MKIIGGKTKGGIIVPTPDPTFSLFDFDENPPGVENLDAAWTVNGQTVYPTLRYNAADASPSGWPAWGYGGPLAEAGAGVSPTYKVGSPFMGKRDNGVKYNGTGTKYHLGQDVVPTIGTNDIIIEYIFRATNGSSAGVPGLFDLRLNTATPGLTAYKSVAHHISALYGTSTGGIYHYFTSPIISPVDGRYAYVVSCLDNSEGGGTANGIRVWLNGVYSTANYSLLGAGVAGASLSAGEKLKIGYVINAGSVTCEESIMYFAMWNKADLFAAAGGSWSEMDTFVATRAQRLFGIYPKQARGTAQLSGSVRNYPAHTQKLELDGTTKLYSVSNNWGRATSVKNGNNSNVLKGMIIEPAATQRIIQSEDLTSVSWLKNNCSIASTSVVCPTGFPSVYTVLHEDATAGSTHVVSQSGVTQIVSSPQVYSAFIKPINRNWVALTTSTSPATTAYFDVSSRVVGTQTNCTGGIDPTVYTNGWVRVYSYFIPTSTTTHVAGIYAASADNTNTFDGLNQDSLAVWGVQSETSIQQPCPTSYISSSTGVIIRLADTLRYIGNDGNLSSSLGTGSYVAGTIEANIFLPNCNFQNNAYICDLTGSNTNRISLYVNPNGDILQASASLNGISQYDVSGSTDITDGTIHTVKHVFQTNNASIFVDGVLEGSPDSACSSSVGLRYIDVGQSSDQLNQLGGVISKLKIYDRIK